MIYSSGKMIVESYFCGNAPHLVLNERISHSLQRFFLMPSGYKKVAHT